jgi:hypothetical protein
VSVRMIITVRMVSVVGGTWSVGVEVAG